MNALIPVQAVLDDHTFLTKSGDLLQVLALQGLDYECRDVSELEQLARRFQACARVFDEKFRLYQYMVKRDNPNIPARAYANPIVQEVVKSRVDYFKTKATNLYTVDIYLAVVYEGARSKKGLSEKLREFLQDPRAGLRAVLSPHEKITLLGAELDRARETLTNKVMGFIIQLPDGLRAQVLDKEQAFRFLRGLVNYAPQKADGVRLKYDGFVDFQACDSALECHRDSLRLDDYYVQALALKEPPSQTFAHLLRGLQEIPCNFIIVTEWRRESSAAMRKLIQSKRRHIHSAKASMMNYVWGSSTQAPKDVLIDDSAAAVVAKLGECLEEIEIKGHAFGEFSLAVVLYNEDRLALRRCVAECFKVFAAHDAQLVEEHYNLLNTWLAVLPGNSAYNLRRLWLLDSNYADLSFLFTLHPGEKENAHLGLEYLAVLETNHGTPYFLNLHYQDVAHTLVLGATGSGKSFLLNFLIAHLQKYEPFTYIFDLGPSYKNLTRLFDGTYVQVGMEDRSFQINPFTLPPSQENLHFLFAFLKVLIESGAFTMSAQDDKDLYDQIENLYVVEPDQRRLSTLANMLSRRLRAQLQMWIAGGPYASFFDNVNDNLTFARFQTFDFERMDKVPQVLEPLLFYILHRANAAIHDSRNAATFKVFGCDEAWRFFRHPTTQLYITEALKTWRKKNAAMLLATQSTDDLLHSEMLSVIVESCATKMFLANPDLDRKTYREIFHLNETETNLIAHLVPKQQVLVKRPDMAKVLNLNVGATSERDPQKEKS